MKLIQGSPPALPGSCYLCGNGSRDVYVDLETQVEFHGAMYLCDKCVIQMGTAVGMVSVEKHEKFLQELERVRAKAELLEEERSSLKKVLRGYDDVRAFITDGSVPSFRDDSAESNLSEREKELGGRTPRPSKQSDVKRLDDLRAAPKS